MHHLVFVMTPVTCKSCPGSLAISFEDDRAESGRDVWRECYLDRFVGFNLALKRCGGKTRTGVSS